MDEEPSSKGIHLLPPYGGPEPGSPLVPSHSEAILAFFYLAEEP
jgi:hypothetical protein